MTGVPVLKLYCCFVITFIAVDTKYYCFCYFIHLYVSFHTNVVQLLFYCCFNHFCDKFTAVIVVVFTTIVICIVIGVLAVNHQDMSYYSCSFL